MAAMKRKGGAEDRRQNQAAEMQNCAILKNAKEAVRVS